MRKLVFLFLLPLNIWGEVLHFTELEIEVINKDSYWDVTFTATAIGYSRWDENYNLTSDYGSASVHVSNYTQPNDKANFDFVIDPIAGYNPILAIGLYRISAFNEYGYEEAYFYLDLCTSDYNGCPDIYFKYNYGASNFRNSSNTETIDGTTQEIWELKSQIDRVTTDLEPFAPSNTSATNYNGRPRITWQRQVDDDYITNFNIYRSFFNHNFGYSKIASITNQYYVDYDVLVGYGNTAYYKVKAVNGTKESDFSNYASINYYGLNKPFFNDSNGVELVNNKYRLYSNYPNPFNPSTTIKYSISSPGNVKLQVYNLRGEEVTTLVNEFKKAGDYIVEFKAFNYLPSSTYIYRISTKEYSEFKKMMLLK